MELATAEDLKLLRENPSKHMTLISFWATWVWLVHRRVR